MQSIHLINYFIYLTFFFVVIKQIFIISSILSRVTVPNIDQITFNYWVPDYLKNGKIYQYECIGQTNLKLLINPGSN